MNTQENTNQESPKKENLSKDRKPYHFQPGNKLAVGRKHAYNKQICALRDVIFRVTTPHDMEVIWKKLLFMAKRGNMSAMREVLDRCFGKAIQAMEITTEDAEDNVKVMSTEDLMRLAVGNN